MREIPSINDRIYGKENNHINEYDFNKNDYQCFRHDKLTDAFSLNLLVLSGISPAGQLFFVP